MAEEASTPGSVAQAAAQAVSPDPLTASLLAKHSAGEKLSPREYGKLGAFAKKAKAFFSGGPGPNPEQAKPPFGSGQPPGLAPLPQSQAEAGSLPTPPPDPGIVRRTTGTILNRCEAIARRKVLNAAKEAGANDQTLGRFDAAVRIPKDDRELMTDLSPEVAASLGLDPSAYPLAVFCGAFGLWLTDIWLIVDDLKKMKAAKPAEPSAASAKPDAVSSVPAAAASQIMPTAIPPAFPIPERPPGAPPLVTAKK